MFSHSSHRILHVQIPHVKEQNFRFDFGGIHYTLNLLVLLHHLMIVNLEELNLSFQLIFSQRTKVFETVKYTCTTVSSIDYIMNCIAS